jgi:hypothetical protein
MCLVTFAALLSRTKLPCVHKSWKWCCTQCRKQQLPACCGKQCRVRLRVCECHIAAPVVRLCFRRSSSEAQVNYQALVHCKCKLEESEKIVWPIHALRLFCKALIRTAGKAAESAEGTSTEQVVATLKSKSLHIVALGPWGTKTNMCECKLQEELGNQQLEIYALMTLMMEIVEQTRLEYKMAWP